MKRLKQHSMAYTSGVARQAAVDVTHFLENYWQKYTVAVHNVEDDKAFQAHDVDLLWTIVDGNGRLRTIAIEIKGDRYHHTGNFFFETISNTGKGTPGCFLYTKAHWLFYYFVEIGYLYCLPMNTVQPWFYENSDRFRDQATSTPAGDGRYVTMGRLVPIQTVLDEVPGVRQYCQEGDSWKEISTPLPLSGS